jgi:N-acetylmuramoyl-L-alanine amidase
VEPMKTYPIQPGFAHKARPAGTVIDTVILHATAGSTLEGAISTLRAKGYGYQYLIDKDGKVYKGAPANAAVAHAGDSVGPQGRYCNRYTIGVCFVNLNGQEIKVVDGKKKLVVTGKLDPYTPAQMASCRELLRELRKAIPTLKYLTTHAIVSPGRKTDPLGFNYVAMAADTGLTAWRPAK